MVLAGSSYACTNLIFKEQDKRSNKKYLRSEYNVTPMAPFFLTPVPMDLKSPNLKHKHLRI